MIKAIKRKIWSWMKQKVLDSEDVDVTAMILRTFCDGACFAHMTDLKHFKNHDPEKYQERRVAIKTELMEFSFATFKKMNPECFEEDGLQKAMDSMSSSIDNHLDFYSGIKNG